MAGEIVPFRGGWKEAREIATIVSRQNLEAVKHTGNLEQVQRDAEVQAATADWHKRLTQKIFRDDVEVYEDIIKLAGGNEALGRLLVEHAQEYFKANSRRIRNFGSDSKWL